MHGVPIIPTYMKVSVDKVFPAYKTLKLPVPSGDESVALLGQAIGSFIQWPQCRIIRMKETTVTPTSKNKDQQMKTTMPTSVLALEIDLVAENTTSAPILQQKDALKNAQKAVEKADVQNVVVQKAAVQKAALQKVALQKAAVQKSVVQKSVVQKVDVQKAALQKVDVQKEKVDVQKAGLQQSVVQKAALQKSVVQKAVAQVALKQTPKQLQALTAPQKAARSDAQKAAAQEAKEALENRLIDVGDTIGVRGPLSNAAYLRWMSRDDSTSGYVVDVPAGMFVGQEESFSITIDASDILQMWTNGKLDASIVTYFNWGLYNLMQSSSNRCGILNPYLIQGSQCLLNSSGVKDYLTRAFSSGHDIFLAPFIEKENHWVLFVVCPKQRTCYILDSHQPKDKKRSERTYWLTSCLNKFVAIYKVVECNQQAGLWECGYYMLKWMHEFVTVHQYQFPNTIPWHDKRTFSMSQIEDTIEKWHQLCPI